MFKLHRKRTILKYILLAIITGCSLFYYWWAFIFFPDDYDITRQEALLESKTNGVEVISADLISDIDKAKSGQKFKPTEISVRLDNLLKEGYLIKNDSLNTSLNKHLVFRVATGLPGIWVDERESIIIPAQSSLTWNEIIKPDSHFEFSLLALQNSGVCTIEIYNSSNNKIIKEYKVEQYIPQYKFNDVKMKMNNIGYEKARADLKWRDYAIDLGAFKNQKVKIKINFNTPKGNLFLATPRIFSRINKRKRYNIVYLLFDGVATRYWSFYNKKSKLHPFMAAAIKNDYIVFENMISLGNKTRISTSGLFTSQIPLKTRHGINRNFIPESEKDIFYNLVRTKKLASLPEIFRRNGYISTQIGNSGFTVNLITTGVDYGFERSYEFAYNPYDSYGINHEVFKFLRKNKDREYFIYTHYNTPHKPFYAPIKHFPRGIAKGPLKGMWRPDFLGALSYNDEVFKNINTAFKKNGLLENTIIIIATDHGSHYDVTKYRRGFNYNDVSRLTFCVHLPPDLKKELNCSAKRIKTYVSAINIAPTILDLVNLKPIKTFAGKSFRKIFSNNYPNKTFDKLLWTFGRKTGAVVDQNLYKYIFSAVDAKTNMRFEYIRWGKAVEQTYEEIYDLNNDPWEKKNLVRERQDLLKKFRKTFLKADVHHPERNVLTFYPHKKKSSKITVSINCNSELIKSELYDNKMQQVKKLIKQKINKNSYNFTFTIKEKSLYFIFEHLNDRSPLQIRIMQDGKKIPKTKIYATDMNINLFSNPIILNNRISFLVLNSIKLPLQNNWHGEKDDDISIKISRIDLHRWLDLRRFDKAGISAGMKETLKSWGYIQ